MQLRCLSWADPSCEICRCRPTQHHGPSPLLLRCGLWTLALVLTHDVLQAVAMVTKAWFAPQGQEIAGWPWPDGEEAWSSWNFAAVQLPFPVCPLSVSPGHPQGWSLGWVRCGGLVASGVCWPQGLMLELRDMSTDVTMKTVVTVFWFLTETVHPCLDSYTVFPYCGILLMFWFQHNCTVIC